MKGAVWTGAELLIQDVDPPAVPDGWVEVDVAYVGLCGTDVHIVEQLHPRARPGLLMGHEFTGHVGASSARSRARAVFANPFVPDGSCPTCRRGDTHLCPRLAIIGVDAPGALASRVAVPQNNLIDLPPDLDVRAAALIEPLATAVRAVRRSGLNIGDRVHVVGFGPVGFLTAHVARRGGASHVTVSEPASGRARRAVAGGFEVVDAARTQAHLVFDCVGHPSASPTLTKWARTSGAIVIVGMYPGASTIDVQDVTMRELRLIGSKAYSADDIEAAVNLLRSNVIPIDELITSIVTLAEVPAALERLRQGLEMKVLVHLHDESTAHRPRKEH